MHICVKIWTLYAFIFKYMLRICINMQLKYAQYSKNMQKYARKYANICKIYVKIMDSICRNMHKICIKYARK